MAEEVKKDQGAVTLQCTEQYKHHSDFKPFYPGKYGHLVNTLSALNSLTGKEKD